MPVVSSSSPTPANRPLPTLRADILGLLGLSDDADAVRAAETGINNAIRKLNSRVWKWSLQYDDVPSAAQFDFNIPFDVKAPRELQLYNSDEEPNGRLEYKDPKTFMIEHPKSESAGTPSVYTLIGYHTNLTLSLNCVPTTNWIADHPTMRLWYFRNTQFPTGGNAIDVPNDFELWIEMWAENYLARVYSRDRPFVDEERILWRDLIAADNETHDWAEWS